eukprot:jgi/Botrbrau1/13784/Bobra.0056s0035.1
MTRRWSSCCSVLVWSLCRMVHVLRCSPPGAVAAEGAVFEDALHSSLRRLVVAGGPGFGSLQAEIAALALPLSAGGLGIVRAEYILPVAFLASVLQIQRVQEEVLAGWEVAVSRAVEEARSSFIDVCPSFDWELLDEAFLNSDVQRKLGELLSKLGEPFLRWPLGNVSFRSWTRRPALMPRGGFKRSRLSAWAMANVEFRCRLRYQLLIPMFPRGAPCPRCGQMDRWGDHAVQRRVGHGLAVTSRHNAVRDLLFRIGKEVGAVVTREPPLPVRVI